MDEEERECEREIVDAQCKFFGLCIACKHKCDWFKASYPLAGRANLLEGDGIDSD